MSGAPRTRFVPEPGNFSDYQTIDVVGARKQRNGFSLPSIRLAEAGHFSIQTYLQVPVAALHACHRRVLRNGARPPSPTGPGVCLPHNPRTRSFRMLCPPAGWRPGFVDFQCNLVQTGRGSSGRIIWSDSECSVAIIETLEPYTFHKDANLLFNI